MTDQAKGKKGKAPAKPAPKKTAAKKAAEDEVKKVAEAEAPADQVADQAESTTAADNTADVQSEAQDEQTGTVSADAETVTGVVNDAQDETEQAQAADVPASAPVPDKKPVAAAAPAKQPKQAPEVTPAIRVRTKRLDRRCRSGWVFTREPVAIVLSALTAKQLKAIENDPQLHVEACEVSGLEDGE